MMQRGKSYFQKTAEDKVCSLNCVRKSRFLSEDMLFCFSHLFWWAFSTTSKVIYYHQTTLQLISPILSNIHPSYLLEGKVALQEIRNLLLFSFHGDMVSLKHLIKEKKHLNLFVENRGLRNKNSKKDVSGGLCLVGCDTGLQDRVLSFFL